MRAFPRHRLLARRLYQAAPGNRRVFGVRRHKVRFVAVADRSLLGDTAKLRDALRRSGV